MESGYLEMGMMPLDELEEKKKLLSETDRLLKDLASKRSELLDQISELEGNEAISLINQREVFSSGNVESITNQSPQDVKIKMFRNLFHGREDVYARRFESRKTGKRGYQPVCRNEWVAGSCEKPRIRCDACTHRELLPITDDVIEYHLKGSNPNESANREFVVGIYPMLADETCWLLAADFDKAGWRDDVKAFLETCEQFEIPVALERSRSGEGGHVWFFFSEPVPVRLARKMGAFLISRTLDYRPEIGLDSYDRFFPNQDTLPRGGFGNLIALPLQKRPREEGNALFLDRNFDPYTDQWAFLSTIRRMDRKALEKIIGKPEKTDELAGIRMPVLDETEDQPWNAPPSGNLPEPPITGPLPDKLNLVLGDQLYIPKVDLSPALRNRLIRLAAFQNPDFYQAQAMRLSTYGKPRIISCCEDTPNFLCLPRGCLDDAIGSLRSLGINVQLEDKRFSGTPLDVRFTGTLFPEQKKAAEAILLHDMGVLSASTAFGKTVVAAYLIAERKVNTLVLVHRRQLLDQWIDSLGKFLVIEKKGIGQIGGGKRDPTGKIDVAMVQSLFRKGVVDDLVASYGYIIVDECHHISAVSFEQVVRRSKARYFTGLSATVARKDGHHPIIFMQCGPIRFRVSDKSQALKRPFSHRVFIRPTDFHFPFHLKEAASIPIQEVYDLLSKDEKRNQGIAEDVISAVKDGRFPILLTERRDHLERIAELLAEKISNIFILKGGMGKKQRKGLFESIRSLPTGEPRVLLATGRYIGEGFDDERLDTLFLALPISWRGTLTQYAGRLHRFHASKREVIIYDYVDYNIPALVNMFSKRRTGYRKIGYEVENPETGYVEDQLRLPDRSVSQ
jgi:superfamily II DNA or RNA helicase